MLPTPLDYTQLHHSSGNGRLVTLSPSVTDVDHILTGLVCSAKSGLASSLAKVGFLDSAAHRLLSCYHLCGNSDVFLKDWAASTNT